MAARTQSLEIIEDFLAQKRIGMVGISRQPQDFSVLLFKELCGRGYDVVPVNPQASELNGRPCFARVQDIEPRAAAAPLITSPEATDKVVRDCAEAGVRRVWMYRAAGKGAVSQEAIAFCHERGIRVVPGECPFMFLPNAGLGHRIPRFIRKITGTYPRRARIE